jgi:hypothetical protein
MMATTLAQNAYVDVSDLVTITNVGDKTWGPVAYESREYECAPDKTVYVPFFLVVKEFGDPRSQPKNGQAVVIRGVKHFIPSRESEVARLCTIYGIHDNIVGNGLEARAPHVIVKDQSGIQIPTVLDDMKGNSFLPSSPEQVNERDMLEARMAQLQVQIDALKDNQEALPPEDGDDVDEDGPPSYSPGFKP